MTDVYEFSEYERTNLVYNFATMTAADVDQAKTKLAAYEKAEAEKKAAKAAAPAAMPAPAAPAQPRSETKP
jgi:NADH-quinone oxidoreductase subunit I